MIRLLYISTARQEMSDGELGALLEQSRMRNEADGITGLLIVGGRRFLQVLEGPDDAVMQAYKRISVDPRHFATVILSNKPAADRLFPAWSMGYQRGGQVDERGSAGDMMRSLIDPIAEPTVKAYFEQFVIKHLAA